MLTYTEQINCDTVSIRLDVHSTDPSRKSIRGYDFS